MPPNETNSIIGIYDSAERPTSRTLNGDGTVSVSGQPVQVSRLGHPLVNEVVIALQDKDRFNATKPTGDGAFLSYVTNPELPGLLNLLYGIPVPPTPRNDLVTVFLTGVPGLNQPASGTRLRDAAAQHGDSARRSGRTASASSPATTPASRTAGGSPTTWSTSPSAWWRACSCPDSTSRPTTSSATAWT